MSKQLAFYFDASACTGCKACMAACKDRSNLPIGVNWRRVHQYGGGQWVPNPLDREFLIPSQMFAYSISVACMHCEKPLCAEVCPAKAITKNDDGVVTVNQDLCIGCRYCEWACPYSAPQFLEERGVMSKCDMCQDLQAQGLQPVCVDACVMRALQVGELDDLRAKYGNENAIEPLPLASFSHPAFVVTPHKHSQPSGEGIGRLIDPFEEV